MIPQASVRCAEMDGYRLFRRDGKEKRGSGGTLGKVLTAWSLDMVMKVLSVSE